MYYCEALGGGCECCYGGTQGRFGSVMNAHMEDPRLLEWPFEEVVDTLTGLVQTP